MNLVVGVGGTNFRCTLPKFSVTSTSEPVRRLTTKGVITWNVSVELLTKCGTSRGNGGMGGGGGSFEKLEAK